MQILNTRTEDPNIFLIILGVALLIVAGICLKRGIWYLRWKTNVTSIFCFMGFLVALILGIALLRNNIGQNQTIYEVMVTDEQSLKEMKRDYTVLKQSSNIYIIKAKKSIYKPLDEKIKDGIYQSEP